MRDWARSHALGGLAAGLAMLGWLVLRLQPMNDVIWQFWIARQMLGGARLYTDIWEVNPPLWFWSAVPVEWLAERTGIGWMSLLGAVVAGLGAVSAWLMVRIIDPPRMRLRIMLLLLVFAATTLMPIAMMGQREQLALALCVPYAALIARRRARMPVPWVLALLVGGLGAYGFALKHYFVMVPLVLEAWLALGLRGMWRPWRGEVLALAGLGVAYGVAVMVLTPDFLRVIVPMVGVAYYALQPSMMFVLVKPYVASWAAAAIYLWLTRDEPRHAAPPVIEAFSQGLLLVAGCFAAAYLIQHRGWDYHSIAVSGMLAIAVGLQAARLKGWVARAIGLALLGWFLIGLYPLHAQRAGYDPLLDHVPAGEAVFVASGDAGAIWPAPETRHLVWASRAYALWMMPAIQRGEQAGPHAAALRDLGRTVGAAVSHDLRCTPPYLIVLERLPGEPRQGGPPALDAFLRRDADLRAFIEAHYVVLPRAGARRVYVRRGMVAKDPRLVCGSLR